MRNRSKDFNVQYIGTCYYIWHIDGDSYQLRGGEYIKIDYLTIPENKIVETIQKNLYEGRMSQTSSFKSFSNFDEFLAQYPWQKYALVSSSDESLKEALETSAKILLDNLRKDMQNELKLPDT